MAKTTEEMLDEFVEARIEGYLIAKHQDVSLSDEVLLDRVEESREEWAERMARKLDGTGGC